MTTVDELRTRMRRALDAVGCDLTDTALGEP
ncbi:MAG: hypothetical protein QOI39_1216, partial [Mycobacterium sp.]|nr:hypothetical protein [Mycobacterium sp.]